MDIDGKSEAESSGDEAIQLPETLIAGRQRRSTAGNRLAQLLEQEQPDDIDLLFEEDGDDDEFEAKHESDVDLGSSSDEEDKPQDQDEYAGEKKLEQEERASKRQKRSFPGQKELDKLVKRQQNLREKRVTIQEPGQDAKTPTDDDESNPRARKKSERISWIPTAEDLPSRQSTRRQTVANKQMIHERMKESNERRLKVIAAMNEASQKKKVQKVELTQEMRLERAKKVEEKNRKSLNKWQEAEEARLEAQRAKLAALHNRKIEGPFIRFYSGRAEYDDNGKLINMGRHKLIEELSNVIEVKTADEKTDAKTDEKPAEPSEEKPAEQSDENPVEQSDEKLGAKLDERPDGKMEEKPDEKLGEKPDEKSDEKSDGKPDGKPNGEPDGKLDERLDGRQNEGQNERHDERSDGKPGEGLDEIIEEKVDQKMDETPDAPASADAENPGEDVVMEDASQGPSVEEKPKETNVNRTDLPEAIANTEPAAQQQHPSPPHATSQVQTFALVPSDADGSPDDTPHKIAEQLQGDLDASIRPPKPPTAPKTFMTLEGFTKRELNNKELASKVIFPYNHGPLPRPDRSLCVTTSLPARYKDPVTGLPYASLFAYKQIQRVKTGALQWNSELQCFFDGQDAADGVPEGFN